jgi:hypothetical protein
MAVDGDRSNQLATAAGKDAARRLALPLASVHISRVSVAVHRGDELLGPQVFLA